MIMPSMHSGYHCSSGTTIYEYAGTMPAFISLFNSLYYASTNVMSSQTFWKNFQTLCIRPSPVPIYLERLIGHREEVQQTDADLVSLSASGLGNNRSRRLSHILVRNWLSLWNDGCFTCIHCIHIRALVSLYFIY